MVVIGPNRDDRKDHIWIKLGDAYKCALCGAVTRKLPPFPTPLVWLPERYEKLTPEEREMAPFKYS